MLPDGRWRPYIATGALLAAAALLNLWAGNRLWLGYTTVGASGLLVAVGLARLKGWFVPARPAWMLGVTAALHYGGGSLAGLHQVGGVNGLYFAFPWWDNAVHLLGSCAVAVAAAAFLAPRVQPRLLAWALATCVAVTVGVGIELYEFAQFAWFGAVDQGYYTNTLLDLYNNALGGAVGAWLTLRAPGGTALRLAEGGPAAATATVAAVVPAGPEVVVDERALETPGVPPATAAAPARAALRSEL